MAAPIVRNASFYAGTKKVAEQETLSYSGKNNAEPMYGDVPGGFINYTQGSVETQLTVTEIIPVPGSSFDFVTALITGAPIDVALSLIDGKIHQIPGMRCLSYKFDSDVKSGMLKGEFTFGGGQPTITG